MPVLLGQLDNHTFSSAYKCFCRIHNLQRYNHFLKAYWLSRFLFLIVDIYIFYPAAHAHWDFHIWFFLISELFIFLQNCLSKQFYIAIYILIYLYWFRCATGILRRLRAYSDSDIYWASGNLPFILAKKIDFGFAFQSLSLLAI